MQIISSSIPHLYPQTYTDSVATNLLVYNPISEKGLAVLNREAQFLFHLVDGKRTIKEIYHEALKQDHQVKITDINNIFQSFYASEIIHFRNPKNKLKMFTKKPKHLGVWLHITNQCNLRCKYCYVWKTGEKMKEEIGAKAIGKILRDAKKHGFTKISLKFSGGECLLEFDHVLELLKLARKLAHKNNIEISPAVLTNGILISDEIAATLKKENIRAAVSLDGLGKYNANRIFPNCKSSFKFVERGIDLLLKYKVAFNVSVTVTRQNVENLPELTKYFLKKNIPFCFNFYRENPFVKEELYGDDKKLVEALKKSFQIIGENPPQYSLINGLLDRVTFKRPHLLTCGMGNSYIVVRHDGTLHSCQMTLEKPIGTIDDPDLVETMRKGNFVRPKGLNVEGKTPCKNCQWKYICCGGCPLLTNEQKNKYDTNSPYCTVYKALIPEALKVEAKRLIKYGKKDN